MQKLFFPALTGYRAIAAWIIFIYHFFPFKNISNKYPLFLQNIISEFHIGVDMFFVLSGFLITYRYFNDKKVNFKSYMVNRFARIYPMYFIITIFVFMIFLLSGNEWSNFKTLEFITSITMTKALFTDFFLSGIQQGWTLTIEEIFYFCAPFYFLLIKKNKIFLLTIPFIIFFTFNTIEILLNNNYNVYGFLQTKLQIYVGEFFIGIIIGIIVLKNLIKKIGYWTYFGIIFIFLYLIIKKNILIDLFNFKSNFNRFLELIFISIFGIGPLIIGLVYENTFISKILSSKIMVLLGKSSYVFYLIHKGFIPIFIDSKISDNKFLLFLMLNLISILLFYFLEEPLNKFIKSRYKKLF